MSTANCAFALMMCLIATRALAGTGSEDALNQIRLDVSSLVGTEGFFRVGKDVDGRWWLVDAQNRPFFYRGVTSINRAGKAGGRRAQDGPYAETVDARYDYRTAGPDRFVEATIARLRDWGFNATGAWTEPTFHDRGIVFTETLEFAHTPQVIKEHGIRMPDVFDPAWEAEVERVCAEFCPPLRNSKLLLGYFTDNELSWLQPSEEDLSVQTKLDEQGQSRSKPTLLQAMLSIDPARPAYAAAWAFVLERHGSIEKLGDAWGVPMQSRDDLRAKTLAGDAILTAGYMKDQVDFTTLVAERYFRITSEAIRRHDPNHLILGCRFGAPPGPVVLKQCVRPHVDVVSANNYRDTMFERMSEYYDHNGMPILIGEFAWASDYYTRRAFPGEPAGLPREQRMIIKGRTALERTFTHPAVVGYTWYRWVETDPKRVRPWLYGLVHMDDEPNTLTIDALRETNNRAERIRAGRIAPITHADQLEHLAVPAGK